MDNFKQFNENVFRGYESDEFDHLTEAHALAGIVKKNGMKVVKTPKTVGDLMNIYRNEFGLVYTDDGKYAIHVYEFGGIAITELTNAMQTGKTCKDYWINDKFRTERSIQYAHDSSMTFDQYLALIEGDKFKAAADPEYANNVSAGMSLTKGMRVFSPFAFGKLKRVAKIPPKISISHVIKLIANGQFKLLSRDYKYTDDYAFDNATNFGKSDNVNPIHLVKEMIERGWSKPYSRVTESGDTVITFGPHSNESYTLVVDLSKKLMIKV